MSPAVHESTLFLRSSRGALWPLVSQTERTNRLLGAGPVSYSANADARSAARFIGETSVGGFKLVYEELPFEWDLNRGFRVTRLMRGGAIASVRYDMRLEDAPPTDDGPRTKLTLRIEVAARSALLRPLAWIVARGILNDNLAIFTQIDDHLQHKADSPFLLPRASVDTHVLDRATRALEDAGVRPALATRLRSLVVDASDADAVRLRPFEWADTWREARAEVLSAMLSCVAAGMLELRWSLLCPSCMTSSSQVASLKDLEPPGHCQACDIRFDLDLDRAVEATFVPHPSIRKTEAQIFCIGGPGRTPHVLSQHVVNEGESLTLDAPGLVGRYRLFSRGGALTNLEVREDGAASIELRIASDVEILPGQAIAAPGAGIVVHNNTGAPRHVKLERIAFADAAVTAQLLTTMPEFRRLFSAELLKPKTPLKVARVALLFSDLTGSTALYADVGDAVAFRFVDDHFDALFGPIEQAGGVIVKTMGDAVMASFDEIGRAASAGAAALAAFETFRLAHPHGANVGLKLGVYAGPCYVVTANEKLDYFGQTVNVAARLQGLADSSEIVMLKAHFESMRDTERALFVVKEAFETKVKGVSDTLHVVRLSLAR